MADIKSPEHPLEVLPAMLNLVLIQTGNLLRDPDSHHPRAIGLTRSKINEYVPVANDRFHDALDEIEIKILDAKAVMERDLAVIRRKRAERLGVKIGPKTPTPVVDDTNLDFGLISHGDVQAAQAGDIDLAMLDVPVDDADKHGDMGLNGEMSMVNVDGMPSDQEISSGLAISLPAAADGKDQDKAAEAKDANAADANANEAQNVLDSVAEAADFDFDTMFNDTDLAADMDLGNQDLLADDAFQNVAMSGTNLSNAGSTNNEDISTLLPGFDDVIDAANVPSATNGDQEAAAPDPAATTSQNTATDANIQSGDKVNASDPQLDDIFGADFKLDDNANVGDLADFNFDEEWMKFD